MATTDMRFRLYFPPTWSLILAVLAGGLPFSFALLRLGIDMESPELLRYALLGSPLLGALGVAIAMCLTTAPLRRVVVQCMWCSFAMWVPIEALTYIGVSWDLRGWTVFSFNNLPFLLVLLICWSVAIALISAFIAIAIRRTIALARQLRKSR